MAIKEGHQFDEKKAERRRMQHRATRWFFSNRFRDLIIRIFKR